ncbi:hypothetical protein V7075_14890, partial [Neobacillus drentensis]|uniref:hypothetical protein n=1 Tax=Neobacillus drentensis TaxID=220684 RepID=UPI002FFDECEC
GSKAPYFKDLLRQHYNSMDCQIHFHSLWCSADFALHGWLTGQDSSKRIIQIILIVAQALNSKVLLAC